MLGERRTGPAVATRTARHLPPTAASLGKSRRLLCRCLLQLLRCPKLCRHVAASTWSVAAGYRHKGSSKQSSARKASGGGGTSGSSTAQNAVLPGPSAARRAQPGCGTTHRRRRAQPCGGSEQCGAAQPLQQQADQHARAAAARAGEGRCCGVGLQSKESVRSHGVNRRCRNRSTSQPSAWGAAASYRGLWGCCCPARPVSPCPCPLPAPPKTRPQDEFEGSTAPPAERTPEPGFEPAAGVRLGAGAGSPALGPGPVYRPSAVPKGKAAVPVATDGKVGPSTLESKRALLERLQLSEAALEARGGALGGRC